MGIRIGPKSRMLELVSINIPTIINSTFRIRRKTTLLWVTENMASVRIAGILVCVIIMPAIVAKVISIAMDADEIAPSDLILTTSKEIAYTNS